MVLLAIAANYKQILVQLCYVNTSAIFAKVKDSEIYVCMHNNGGNLADMFSP